VKKSTIILTIIIIVIFTVRLAASDQIVVLPLPFTESSGTGGTNIGEVIQKNLISFFESAPGYRTVTLEEMDSYLSERGLGQTSLGIGEVANSLAARYNAGQIIQGTCSRQGRMIIINLEVLDVESGKIIYRGSRQGRGKLGLLATVDEISSYLVEDFTGIALLYGTLTITTDLTADVLIDSINMGTTPFKRRVKTGKRTVQLYYRGSLFFEKSVNVEAERETDIDTHLFCDVTIGTEADGLIDIYLNGEWAGSPPLKQKFLTNNRYTVDFYLRNRNRNYQKPVYTHEFSTGNLKELRLDLTVLNSVSLEGNSNRFYLELNRKPVSAGINRIGNLVPGNYRLQVYLIGDGLFAKMLYRQHRFILGNGSAYTVNLNKYGYQKRGYLGLIPSAMQFYHQQYIKAGFLLTGFSVGATFAGLSPLLLDLLYRNWYQAFLNRYNGPSGPDGLSPTDIQNAFNWTWAIFTSVLSVSAVLALTCWIVSLADGLWHAKRFVRWFQLKTSALFSVDFELRFR
jgi:TolB-like protein